MYIPLIFPDGAIGIYMVYTVVVFRFAHRVFEGFILSEAEGLSESDYDYDYDYNKIIGDR